MVLLNNGIDSTTPEVTQRCEAEGGERFGRLRMYGPPTVETYVRNCWMPH
jgi:hypothetical protein